MNVDIDVFGSKEIDINPQERRRKKKIDDYDYTDPFIERFEGEDDAVEIEPHIENFFMYEGTLQEKPSKVLSAHTRASKKTNNKKEAPAKPFDVIYCMQNLIYSKMLENACDESDVAEFLLYDLIINHDTNFERAKEKVASSGSPRLLSTELIKLGMNRLQSTAASWHEQVASILSQDDAYDGSNVVFTDRLCDAVFHYTDAKVKIETYSMEVENSRKVNYNNARRNAYAQVYLLLKEGTQNHKQLGYYVYKYTRKQKIGRYNGFKPEYLTTEREKEPKFEGTFDTFSSAGEVKRSQESHVSGCKEKARCSAHGAESAEGAMNALHKVSVQKPAECALKEHIVSGNDSCSLQRVESQWLETMQDNAKDDVSESKGNE